MDDSKLQWDVRSYMCICIDHMYIVVYACVYIVLSTSGYISKKCSVGYSYLNSEAPMQGVTYAPYLKSL